MELRTLEYFIAIAKECNVSKAAQKLHISQPSLSVQLKKLESELGVILFDRSNNLMQLTQAGKFLLDRAEEILKLVRSTQEEILKEQFQIRGKIVLAVAPTVSPVLSPLIIQFNKKYENVTFNLFEGDGEAVLDLVRSDIVEAGAVRGPVESTEFESQELASEAFVVVAGAGTDICTRYPGSTITLERLIQEPMAIPEKYDSIFPLLNIPQEKLNVVYRSRSLIHSLAFLDNHSAFGIMPSSIFDIVPRSHYRIYSLINPQHLSTSLLIWKKGKALSNAFYCFKNECYQMKQSANSVVKKEL